MSLRHTGPHALYTMEMEYHRHPFGDNRQAMKAVVQPLPAAFDSEKRLDYDTREDDQPVYVGFAETDYNDTDGTIAPLTTDTWVIQKFTYDGSNRVTRIQVARGAWDDRATLF